MKKEEFAEKIYEGISDLNPEFMEEALKDHPDLKERKVQMEQKDHKDKKDEKDLAMAFGEKNGNESGSGHKTAPSKKIIPWRKWAAAAAGICVMAVGIKAYYTYFKPLTPETKQGDTDVNQGKSLVESVETVQVETSDPNGIDDQGGNATDPTGNGGQGGNVTDPTGNGGQGGNLTDPSGNGGQGGNATDPTGNSDQGEKGNKDQNLSKENKADFTAEDVGFLFHAYEMNDRSAVTSSYTVSTYSAENDPLILDLFKLPELPNYMEVYEIKHKEVDMDAFEQFVKQYYSTAMDFVGLEGPKDPPEIEKRDYSGMCTSMYSDYSSGNYRSVLGITRRNCYEMQMSDNGRFL